MLQLQCQGLRETLGISSSAQRGFSPPHPSSARERETFLRPRQVTKASNPARAKLWAAHKVLPVLQETYLLPRQEARRAGEAVAAPNEEGAQTLWIHLLPRGESQPVWHPQLQSRAWCCGSSVACKRRLSSEACLKESLRHTLSSKHHFPACFLAQQ